MWIVYTEFRNVGQCVSGTKLRCPTVNCQNVVRCPLNLGPRVFLVLSFGEGDAESWATCSVCLLFLLMF